jgi:hypothetical protein
MASIIKKITHEFAYELRQARIDHAIVTGKPAIERPFYYENTENGEQFYDLYGCIGWPTEVSEKDDGRPGYMAIIGVIKDAQPIEMPIFRLLAEAESKNIPTLLIQMLAMREKFGYGLHPTLLSSWWGDPERFITTLAIFNERNLGKELMVSPPVDFYNSKRFDDYARSMQSTISKDIEIKRFKFSGLDILKNRLREFKRDDPAVLAVGGLIHTLLLSCEWMDQHQSNMFVLEEEGNV